jgi:hypothetical protein
MKWSYVYERSYFLLLFLFIQMEGENDRDLSAGRCTRFLKQPSIFKNPSLEIQSSNLIWYWVRILRDVGHVTSLNNPKSDRFSSNIMEFK